MSCLDVRNRLFADTEAQGELILRDLADQRADFTNLLPGKRRQPVALSAVALVIACTIWACVLFARTPRQVRQACVALATWAVQGFLPFRALTNKRVQDQQVHHALEATSITPVHERRFGVPVGPDVRTDDLSASPAGTCLAAKRTHLSAVTDFVQLFPGFNRFPEAAARWLSAVMSVERAALPARTYAVKFVHVGDSTVLRGAWCE